MTPLEMESKLTYLLDRREIEDVIRTYTRAVDRLDKEALYRAYAEDMVDDHLAFVGNRDEFIEWAFGLHAEFHDSTHHLVANELVEIDGDVAHAESYFIMSLMNRSGVPFTQSGGRYIDRLEKRDGSWQIVARRVLSDFLMPSINSREAVEDGSGAGNRGFLDERGRRLLAGSQRSRRDRDDLRYSRPLTVDEDRVRARREFKSDSAPEG